MTFFKRNIWNVLVGTVKRDKNLQLQRISRMSKQCFQNAALTGVQKATENSLCGCLFVYLFIYLYLKLLSFLLLGKLSNSFFPYGRLLTHIAELDTSAMEDFFLWILGEKCFQLDSSLLPSCCLT